MQNSNFLKNHIVLEPLARGVAARLRAMSKLWRNFEGMAASVSSPVIKSHILPNLSFIWGSSKQQMRYGLGIQSQSYTVVDTFQNQPKFDQTATYFLLMF